MIILQDSREGLQLTFNHSYVTGVKVQKLDVGDYMVEFNDGHVPPFSFERKSIPDLFGTLTSGYVRFKKEIMRAQASNTMLIIAVEGTMFKILAGHRYSTIAGISMLRKLITLELRYGVRHKFFKNRDEMSEYIAEYFVGVGKEYVRRKKLKK